MKKKDFPPHKKANFVFRAFGVIMAMLLVMGASGAPDLKAVDAPVNDDYTSPVIIDPAALPYTVSLDTTLTTPTNDVEAATSPEPVLSICNLVSKGYFTVWFEYTPTQDETIYLDTLGTDYDTVITVWTEDNGNFTGVACFDDISAEIYQSAGSLNVTAGTSYLIEVAEWSNVGGGQLEFRVNTSLTTPPTVTVTSVGLLPRLAKRN